MFIDMVTDTRQKIIDYIGKNGQVRVAKNSDIGKAVLTALIKETLKVFV